MFTNCDLYENWCYFFFLIDTSFCSKNPKRWKRPWTAVETISKLNPSLLNDNRDAETLIHRLCHCPHEKKNVYMRPLDVTNAIILKLFFFKYVRTWLLLMWHRKVTMVHMESILWLLYKVLLFRCSSAENRYAIATMTYCYQGVFYIKNGTLPARAEIHATAAGSPSFTHGQRWRETFIYYNAHTHTHICLGIYWLAFICHLAPSPLISKSP